MQGYSAEYVFDPQHMHRWRRAGKLMEGLDEKTDGLWRCHEIVRAVYMFMSLGDIARVVDGKCGLVDHSWIELDRQTILDVYTVGRLPVVQLLHVDVSSLIQSPYGHVQLYVEDPFPRKDIDWDDVGLIKNRFAQVASRNLFRTTYDL